MSKIAKSRAFERWAKKGSTEYQELVRYAIDIYQPLMEEQGFEWAERSLDIGKPQVNSMEFQRKNGDDTFDYVVFLFDKYQKPKFKVLSATKEIVEPHKRLKSGRVVQYQSELDKASWWNVRWWQIDKASMFRKNVDKVAKILPYVVRFLDDGTPHPNIWIYSLSEST
jgi:hypothetical protein